MEKLKGWTLALLAAGLLASGLLLLAPLGYRAGILPLQVAMLSLPLALLIGLVVLLLAPATALFSRARRLPRNRNMLLLAAMAGLLPVLVIAPQIMAARSVPPIHDISTDTENPPRFSAIVALRADAPNDLEYATESVSHAEMAALQRQAYPGVQPLHTAMAPEAALAAAAAALRAQGIEVVNIDPRAGTVEGTASTFWFGFKDDVVIRVTPHEQGSIIDVRSVSRVGTSDVGVNARRIMAILDEMAAGPAG